MFNLLKTAVLMAAITALFMAIGAFVGGRSGIASMLKAPSTLPDWRRIRCESPFKVRRVSPGICRPAALGFKSEAFSAGSSAPCVSMATAPGCEARMTMVAPTGADSPPACAGDSAARPICSMSGGFAV